MLVIHKESLGQKKRNPMPETALSLEEHFSHHVKFETIEPEVQAKPFVKWVGGKRSILPILLEKAPEEYERYYEPFLGGAALFFSLQPENAVISDINLNLIRTYQAIQSSVDDVIELLKSYKINHCKENYLTVRDSFADVVSNAELAAKFIYLNKTCYNGLYRVNKSGKFNVPMGSYENPNIVTEENLRAASRVLTDVVIQQGNVEDMGIEANSFYYLDPPYHKTFSSYDKSGFGDEEHKMLAKRCNAINEIGSKFMLSNSDTPYIRDLYKEYNCEIVMAGRMVSCKSSQRGKVGELLIRNY